MILWWDRYLTALQQKAQRKAQQEATETGKPVDDGYGTRWYPPGKDKTYIAGPSPKDKK